MQCPDCGGSSTVEAVSIILAGLAFVVSFASLWLTSLRWPSVEVEHLEDDGGLIDGGMSDDMPILIRLALPVFIYNTGAAATVVRYFAAEDFRERNTGTPLFHGIEPPAVRSRATACARTRRCRTGPVLARGAGQSGVPDS
jgi:hypothetical protein